MIYQAVSIYFRRQSLQAWGKLYFDQSVEEATHANKIIDFLIDQDVTFELPKLPGAKTEFKSPLGRGPDDARQRAEGQRPVPGDGEGRARGGRPHRVPVPRWFIEEQVEEERTAQALVDLVASGINLFQAEPLLDRLRSLAR